MRLRYLHLPNYGVLKDVRVPFDCEPLFRERGDLFRRGDLHFIVGLNGTGKSSLLRALFEVFSWLEGINSKQIDPRMPFPFPVTLVYDLLPTEQVNYERTCIFHYQGRSASDGFFYVAGSSVNEAEYGDWDGWVRTLQDEGEGIVRHAFGKHVAFKDLQSDNLLMTSLPEPLIVYTSGSLALWNRVHEPELSDDDVAAARPGLAYDERPRGWDIHQELGSTDVELSEQQRNELWADFDPNTYATNARCRLLDPSDLKLAAIAIGLSVAAGEVTQLNRQDSRKAWRHALIQQVQQQRRGTRPAEKTARMLLNEVDWWFPTHLSIEYRPTSAKLNPGWHAALLVLCALADEVIRQPLNRMQLVINLGPRICRVLHDIQATYGDRTIPVEVKEIIDRVDGSTSGAQAVLRTLCTENVDRYQADTEPKFARWPIFDTLRSWRKARLVDDATVTIKRVTPMHAGDGELDDVVVTWDDLSDGEQMLLGRMSLLLLLSGRDGSLLLLDEPETHFNDSWKREIIDIVDDNILKTTSAHVVVATHTSIALTDAFASEIIRLTRDDGESFFRPVSFATFGADTGRVMLHVFDTPESIGSRATEVLEILLNYPWTRENIHLLEHAVTVIGGGWPRAKLREILGGLRAASNS